MESRQFLQRPAGRLSPLSRWHHAWFILGVLRDALHRRIAELRIPPRADILDFGCADSPYRVFFPTEANYIRADLPGNALATATIGPGSRVSVPDASVDVVFSTQVLEHVDEPASYLRECFRTIRPGGRLILTTHGLWVYHRDPVDYWRWTADGLVRQVEQAGFRVESVEGIGGLAATSVQFFQDATRHRVPTVLRNPYTFVLQRLAALFDRFQGTVSKRNNAMVYLITGEKPR